MNELSGALAQGGAGSSGLAMPIQIALLLTALSFLSAAMVALTCFTRVVIVLSFVRRALAAPEIPPNSAMISIALFLTLFIMRPTFEGIYEKAIQPYMENRLNWQDALKAGSEEMRGFMLKHTRQADLALFMQVSGSTAETPTMEAAANAPFLVVAPAFMTSELRTAFAMGFCIYLPFLLIDLVTSTVLMAMGMMMTPPVIVSTPLKLLLFVLADGWLVVIRALADSYNV